MDQAAEIALRAVIAYLKAHQDLNPVRFILKGCKAFSVHSAALDWVMVEDGLSETVADLPGGA